MQGFQHEHKLSMGQVQEFLSKTLAANRLPDPEDPIIYKVHYHPLEI